MLSLIKGVIQHMLIYLMCYRHPVAWMGVTCCAAAVATPVLWNESRRGVPASFTGAAMSSVEPAYGM